MNDRLLAASLWMLIVGGVLWVGSMIALMFIK